MTSKFSQLWNDIQPYFDDIFGEKFDYIPMREVVNAPAVPDTSRPTQVDIVGIAVVDGADVTPGGQNMRVTLLSRVSFQKTILPSPQYLDRLRRKSDNKLYEITDWTQEGIHRHLLHVKQVPG